MEIDETIRLSSSICYFQRDSKRQRVITDAQSRAEFFQLPRGYGFFGHRFLAIGVRFLVALGQFDQVLNIIAVTQVVRKNRNLAT